MANSGTLIKTISITKARIAMAVDDCIGRAAPSKTKSSAIACLSGHLAGLGLPTGRRIITQRNKSNNANRNQKVAIMFDAWAPLSSCFNSPTHQ
jgi:hypothetical protein